VKRLLAAVMALVLMMTAGAMAAGKTLGMKTTDFLTLFDLYLDTFTEMGLPHYPLDILDREQGKTSMVKPLTPHCSIDIKQEGEMLKSFKIVSNENKDPADEENRITDIMICFIGALTLTNNYFTRDNTIAELSKIMEDRNEHTYGDINYRYSTTQPISTIVALEVTPAK